MKPLGNKPKKQYEMSEKERLLNQIRKANNEAENYKNKARFLEMECKDARGEMSRYRADHNMIQFLMGQEVFIADGEGMKYLRGLDLIEYCKEQLIKQDQERHAGYETINIDFKNFANQAINEIIRDEVDKLASSQLDAYKYITKGRYDTGSKSKEEGS